MKHLRGWLAIAVAVSLAACSRAPLGNSKGSGGVPFGLGGSAGGTAGGSTRGASGGTAGGATTSAFGGTAGGSTTSASGGTAGGSTASAFGGMLSNGGATGIIGGTQATVTVLQGVFVATGNPTVTRTDHTATLLPNGMVLIAGGSGDFANGGASAELYDPSTGIFTATGSMAAARSEHTATLLPSGKVLLAGGLYASTGAYVASAELYDPSSGSFTAAGSMTVTRTSHTATMLPNGQVLITGGASTSGQFFASAELYDPSAGKFTAIASMTVPRSNHTATLLPNGLVLIAGGRGNRSFGQTAELYDPGVGTFTVTVNMVEEKSYHTATVLPNGKVLIAGGDYFVGGLGAAASGTTAAAELYDPEAGTFAATGSIAVSRAFHTATMLPNGKVLIAGGMNLTNVFASAELYDPEAGTFAATGSMAAHRQHHTATLLPNGKVLIVGFHWSAELYELGGTTTTGGTISTGGVPAAGGATGTSAMTLAEACAKNCALASGLPGCSTTTTECEQNCMTTYDNTSAVNLDLGRQYTAMMICIATNLTSAYDYVCAKPNRPLNKWSPGPYTTCEDLICSWNCDDATLGNFDPWVDIRCAPCGGP